MEQPWTVEAQDVAPLRRALTCIHGFVTIYLSEVRHMGARHAGSVALLEMKDVERTIDDIFAKIFMPPPAEKPAPIPKKLERMGLPVKDGRTFGRISYI